jgi:hypothetical protein
MLNTHFAKSIYLCYSFLFLTAPFTANQKQSKACLFSEDRIAKDTVSGTTGKEILGFSYTASSLPPANAPAPALSILAKTQLNRKGIQFARAYIKNNDDCLIAIKKRSKIPFSIIDSVFTFYGLPVELKYLAVIESELNPQALSRVGARGPWQLMSGTAQDLGLKITRRYDERTSFYKSTGAAAKYLRDLYSEFDDWLLVLAAYNGGPGVVYTAIRKSGSKNFWALQNYLPAETREHVKKFIATHYYFEGRGSATTLTKAENKEYLRTANQPDVNSSASEIPKQIKPTYAYVNQKRKDLATIADAGHKLESAYEKISIKNQQAGKPFESPDQKFKRIMKDSEESLKRSSKVI